MPLEEVLAAVPELHDAQSVEPLTGGLTNTNYKVTSPAGCYVVRISGKDTSLLAIDRENEVHNTIAAAETGVGAPFVAALPEHDALVLGYLDGEVMDAGKLRRGDRRIARKAEHGEPALVARGQRQRHAHGAERRKLLVDDRAGASEFGLQAGLFTNDMRVVDAAFDRLEVGGLMVNDVSTFRVDHMPYGGVKESGNTREGPAYAVRELTEERLIVIQT